MKSSSAVKHQLNLPPAQLTNSSQTLAPRTESSRPAIGGIAPEMSRTNCSNESEPRTMCSRDQAVVDAARLIDQALEDAHITSKEIADLLEVSRSLVDRWRSANYTESPSYTQLLRFPAEFHWQLRKLENRRYGFARRAALDLLEAAGLVALAVR